MDWRDLVLVQHRGNQLIFEFNARRQRHTEFRQIILQPVRPVVFSIYRVFLAECHGNLCGPFYLRIDSACQRYNLVAPFLAFRDALIQPEMAGCYVIHHQFAELHQQIRIRLVLTMMRLAGYAQQQGEQFPTFLKHVLDPLAGGIALFMPRP